MPQKNIFVYKLFLLLNISDFSLFFIQKLHPPEKSHPLPFPSNPPLKMGILSRPPFLKIWLKTQTPVAERGMHTMMK